MFDFRNLPITFLMPWPILVLAGMGLLTMGVALCFGAFWIMSHLQWVS